MGKRKSDADYRTEMHNHSQKAIALFGESHELHVASLVNGVTSEHLELMKTVIAKQREAIKETKAATRIQHILMKRQNKAIKNQRIDLTSKT